jgi:hypothetical protein
VNDREFASVLTSWKEIARYVGRGRSHSAEMGARNRIPTAENQARSKGQGARGSQRNRLLGRDAAIYRRTDRFSDVAPVSPRVADRKSTASSRESKTPTPARGVKGVSISVIVAAAAGTWTVAMLMGKKSHSASAGPWLEAEGYSAELCPRLKHLIWLACLRVASGQPRGDLKLLH